MNMENNRPSKPTTSMARFGLRWTWKFLKAFVACILLYMGTAWGLARVPVNTAFQNAGDEGIDIVVVSNGVHVDLILPLDRGEKPLRASLPTSAFQVDPADFSYACFGWGNRRFYLETQRWSDLKVSNVLFAFSGLGDTAVHIDLRSTMDYPLESSRQLRVTPEQFRRIQQHILETMVLDEALHATPIENAHYHEHDAFFVGKGSYSLFRTCNVWVGEGLKKGGVRVGVWTVTPASLFACLPPDRRSLETFSTPP